MLNILNFKHIDTWYIMTVNHIGGIMVSGQTKDYKIGICDFFAKNKALR